LFFSVGSTLFYLEVKMKMFLIPVLATGMISFSALAQSEAVDSTDNNAVVENSTDQNLSADSEDFVDTLSSNEIATEEMLVTLGAIRGTEDQQVFARHHSKACEAVKLTDDQKKALGDAFYAAKRETVQLRANLKLDKMDYMRNLASDKGDAATAAKLAEDINKNVTAMVTNKLTLASNVFFTILTPEQRKPAFACGRQMKKAQKQKRMKKMCSGHHGKHHHGHHGGHDNSSDEAAE
jgi:Spy/CpxP family protein refolding chaperone